MPFDAEIVPVKIPAALGVPESSPALLRLSPSGKAPEVTANVGIGVPVAVQLWL
jgi:hypothetical protein